MSDTYDALVEMTDEELKEFARQAGVPYLKAAKARDRAIYRLEYREKYNRRDYVKAKRAARNKREYQLQKALKSFANER